MQFVLRLFNLREFFHITAHVIVSEKSASLIARTSSFETRRGRDEVKTRSIHLKSLPKNQTFDPQESLKKRSRRIVMILRAT